MDLVTVWFALVVLCWVLFFVLEGFDFGVGVLAPLLGRTETERSAAIRTIGPFWDGNEVWLVAAVGATFAAFPDWYAAMTAGLYLPMVVILLLLAGRGVALEFRGKSGDPLWRHRCDRALAACSAGVAAAWGAVLAVLAGGLALGPDGEVRHPAGGGALAGVSRSLDPVLSWSALVGAGLGLAAAALLGATFLALRTTGPVRARAGRLAVLLAAVFSGTALACLLVAVASGGPGRTGVAVAVLAAVVLVGGAGLAARAGREASAFALTTTAVSLAVVAVFTGQVSGEFPWTDGGVVLRSTLDPAWSLTLEGGAASPGALRLITVAAAVILPGVLVYQSFSYWVFRRRVASERVAS